MSRADQEQAEELAVLWRRLDAPGHDACRFRVEPDRQLVKGTAVFLHEGAVTCLSYRLESDGRGRTLQGKVHGHVGAAVVDLVIERAGDERNLWRVNGAVVPGLEACAHLDFGFTPATNFPQLFTLGLQPGQAAELLVAWLDVPVPAGPLRALPQHYRRRDEVRYAYAAPTVPYEGELVVTPAGIVRHYPGLWVLEEPAEPR
jgi:hypothetical protein